MPLTYKTKKAAAIVIIAVIAALQILFLAVLLSLLTDEQPDTELLTTTLSFLFVLGLLTFPLVYGIRLLKEVSMDRLISTLSIPSDTCINVSTKIDKRHYRNLILKMSFLHPFVIFLYTIGLSMFALGLAQGNWNYWVIFIALFLLYLPVGVIRHAGKSYDSTPSLHEVTTFEFTPNEIRITGESYNTNMAWTTLYKVREFGGWFLLHSNSKSAILIPKSAFPSKDVIDHFRNMSLKLTQRN